MSGLFFDVCGLGHNQLVRWRVPALIIGLLFSMTYGSQVLLYRLTVEHDIQRLIQLP